MGKNIGKGVFGLRKGKDIAALFLVAVCMVLACTFGHALYQEQAKKEELEKEINLAEGTLHKKNMESKENLKELENLKFKYKSLEIVYNQAAYDTQYQIQNQISGSRSNEVNGKLVAYDGFWIYYVSSKENEGNSIFKMLPDGSKKKKLIERERGNYMGGLSVMEGRLYYKLYSTPNPFGGAEYECWSIGTDGSNKRKEKSIPDRMEVFKDSVKDSAILDDGYIYFTEQADKHDDWFLYRTTVDGKNKQKLTRISPDSFSYAVAKGWIYFNNKSHGSVYKMRANGTELEQLLDRTAHTFNIIGDWVYCLDEKNESYRFRLDGSMWHKI